MLDELADPFGTAALRGRVLDAWTASPARFREDANAEEDYALGGYRDRVVVELAQNAADAAARAGVPGRLRLTLRDGTLTAANTGAPLDAAGVEALSTLRASSKRGPAAGGATVGRFGVGFAAVVAVSAAPRIRSLTGSVGWSRDRTRELVHAVPALAGELAERGGHVPVLRLPFPAADPDDGQLTDGLAGGFATVVELPLRDEAAERLVARLFAETGPALLLALPALAEVVIEVPGRTRVLTAEHTRDDATITADGAVSRWRVAAAGGELDAALLTDRPTEERARASWSVRWAVPLAAASDTAGDAPAGRLPDGVSAVVHAPTPTDEPLGLPALLLASFPLSPDRRHVAPGPLTDFLVERAAETYAGMLPGLAPGPGLLDLVPGPVGRGELDARLGRAILARLPDVAFLPAADAGDAAGTPSRVRPRDALLLGTGLPGLAEWLSPVLPNLIAGPGRHPAYAMLGVRRLPLAELADTLAALDRPPAWWRRLYELLAAASPEELAELGALPVPLADGRLVRGPRGLLLPGPGLEHPGGLSALGLRVVAPEAAHPLLARLGAVEATPRSVLTDPATRAAVANSYDAAADAAYDDDGPERVADTVLGLVAAVNAEGGEYPWLAELALRDADGEWSPAGDLLLPGGPLAALVGADAPFGTIDQETLERYGAAALQAAGVLSSFDLLTAEDVDLSETDLDLDEAEEWAEHISALLPRVAGRALAGAAALQAAGVPPVAVEVVAVRDLEFVDPGRWPQALDLLARPPLRAALVEPTRVRLADGRHAGVPSYTAWWLRRHVVLAGRRPAGLRAPGSDPLLAGLYDDLGSLTSGALADPAVARALGVRTSLAELLTQPDGPGELLARLADPARPVSRPQLRAIWAALATAELGADEVRPPDRIRAVRGDTIIVADAEEVLVLDAPDLWPLVADQALVLSPHTAAERLADLLDLPLVSEEVAGLIESAGEPSPVPDIVRAVLPASPPSYQAHDKLVVDGAEVDWRYRSGEIHASTPAGLAAGLAWASGEWPRRDLLAELLITPASAAHSLAAADLDPL